MTRPSRKRLEDILVAIDRAERRLGEGLPDEALHDALCYQLLVIGEAVKSLDASVTEETPEVPWRQISGLRDVIAHEYFRIDVARIREIVEKELPVLRAEVERLLGR